MKELERTATEVCAFFSLNSLEYAEVRQVFDFEMRIAENLRTQGFDAKVHVISSATFAYAEGFEELLESIEGLKFALSPELWFFGSDLNMYVFMVLEKIHSNTIVRNHASLCGSLNLYLDLFKGVKKTPV